MKFVRCDMCHKEEQDNIARRTIKSVRLVISGNETLPTKRDEVIRKDLCTKCRESLITNFNKVYPEKVSQ